MLVPLGLVCLALGWSVRPIAIWLGAEVPQVTWLQVAVLWFLALVVLVVARLTWRTLRTRRTWMEPHRAVNRLVLGKASALAGAVVAGGYLGFAISFVGLTEVALNEQRLARSLVAGAAGLVLSVAGLWLENACRTNDEDAGDLP